MVLTVFSDSPDEVPVQEPLHTVDSEEKRFQIVVSRTKPTAVSLSNKPLNKL